MSGYARIQGDILAEVDAPAFDGSGEEMLSIGYAKTELDGVWTYVAPAFEETETATSNP